MWRSEIIFDCEINEVDGSYRIVSDRIGHLFLQGESDRTPLLGREARLLPYHTFLPLDNQSWTKDVALHTSCMYIFHSLSSFLCFCLLGGDASRLMPSVLLVLNFFNSWPWWPIYFRPKLFSRMLPQKVSPRKGLPSHKICKWHFSIFKAFLSEKLWNEGHWYSQCKKRPPIWSPKSPKFNQINISQICLFLESHLWTEALGLRTKDWGLRTEDWVSVLSPQYPILNLQSYNIRQLLVSFSQLVQPCCILSSFSSNCNCIVCLFVTWGQCVAWVSLSCNNDVIAI